MEDFVPYELAVKLKEKGFREKCFARYSFYAGTLKYNEIDVDKRPSAYKLTIKEFGGCYNLYMYNDIDAPTISQVLKWLREKKNIFVVTFIADDSDAPLTYEIYMGTECLLTHHGEYFTLQEWDKCNLVGIEYVLDNLI